MSMIRLLLAFAIGVICALFSASILSSAQGPLNSGDLLAAAIAMLAASAFLFSATSSAEKRVYVFAVSAALLAILGIGLIAITKGTVSPETLQAAGASPSDASVIAAGQAKLRLQGIYILFSGIFLSAISAALHFLRGKRVSRDAA